MRSGALALVVGVVVLAGCGESLDAGRPATAPVTSGPSITWRVSDLSDDARTVSVFHEEPHCQTRPGRAQLTEDARAVRIRIPLVRSGLPKDTFCTADLRYTTTKVRLAAPLGRRRLEQAKGRIAKRSTALGTPCPRLLRAPRDAPLFDVPMFAALLADCRKPVPPGVLAMPIFRVPPGPDDRITTGERDHIAFQPFFLRRDLARSVNVGPSTVKLIPGAETSCVLVRYGRFDLDVDCALSDRVARRGLFVEDVCNDRTPPRRVRVLGVAPLGVPSVRMTRKGRTVATADVVDGAFSISGDDALRLHVGDAVLRLRAATTLC